MRYFPTILRCALLLTCSATIVAAQGPALRATASGDLKVAFVADENNLRRLAEVMRKRMAEQVSDFKLKFTVTFADNSFYETSNPDLVYKEENPRTRKIVALAIAARSRPRAPQRDSGADDDPDEVTEPEIRVKLQAGQLDYSVRGSNRDWVLNTQSDIRERFAIMGTGSVNVKPAIASAGGIVGLFGTFLLGAGWWRNRYDRKMKEKDANHQQTKLRTYIGGGVKDPDFSGFVPMIFFNSCIAIGFLLGFVGNRIGEYLFPDAVFALGEQVGAYDDMKRLRTTLMWGVIIAFVISVVGSIVANVAVSRRRAER